MNTLYNYFNLNRSITAGLFLLLAVQITAQNPRFTNISVPVVQNGQLLNQPFAGGLNAPQFSEADLNNDGVMDLVIFDRAGSVVLTFINNWTGGTGAYKYAPEYARTFPKLKNYALLRDYNQDGAMDIFCNALMTSSQGISAFRGYYQDNVLHFAPYVFYTPGCTTCNPDIVYYPDQIPGNYNNMSVADVDIPSFDDIDNDGDIDIVAFNSGNSTNLWWLKNRSVELGYGLDSLKYVLEDDCWGRFYENGMEGCRAQLSPSADDCSHGFAGAIDDRDALLHPGATVLTLDMDGDLDREAIMGTISYSCLNMLTNGGTPNKAWMTSQDTLFPKNDATVDIQTFPGAFHLDVTGDGKKDLIAAPNSGTLTEDRAGVWLYENVSNDDSVTLELSTKRFMVGGMIDQGTGAHPAFADVNADGLLDLVVGNVGYYANGAFNNARLALYLNTGTFSAPEFTLNNADWLQLSQFGTSSYDYAPAFGDMDNDGDIDLILGTYSGFLLAYFNTAGAGNPMTLTQDFNTMWLNMDVGNSSTPLIHDLNGDNKPDLLVGNLFGIIAYFQNIGSLNEPVYGVDETMLPNLSTLGAVNAQTVPTGIGYSAPVIIDAPGGKLLVIGTQDGHLEVYQLDGVTNQPYTLVDMELGGLDEGRRSCPAFADLNDDGTLELVVGNLRGGLSMYRTELAAYTPPVATNEPQPAYITMSIAPNPAKEQVQLSIPTQQSVSWRITDVLGREIQRHTTFQGNLIINVNNWQSGTYIIEAQTGGQRLTERLVVHQ